MAMITPKLVFPPPAIPYVSVEQRFAGSSDPSRGRSDLSFARQAGERPASAAGTVPSRNCVGSHPTGLAVRVRVLKTSSVVRRDQAVGSARALWHFFDLIEKVGADDFLSRTWMAPGLSEPSIIE
jgi:hypothetical protein